MLLGIVVFIFWLIPTLLLIWKLFLSKRLKPRKDEPISALPHPPQSIPRIHATCYYNKRRQHRKWYDERNTRRWTGYLWLFINICIGFVFGLCLLYAMSQSHQLVERANSTAGFLKKTEVWSNISYILFFTAIGKLADSCILTLEKEYTLAVYGEYYLEENPRAKAQYEVYKAVGIQLKKL